MSKYWEIFVDEVLPEIIDVPADKRAELLKAIVHHSEMEYEASGTQFIPDPRETELKQAKARLEKATEVAERDRWFWEEAYLRGRGFSPDRFYVRRDGDVITVLERR